MSVIPKIPRTSGGFAPLGPLPGFYPGPAGNLKRSPDPSPTHALPNHKFWIRPWLLLFKLAPGLWQIKKTTFIILIIHAIPDKKKKKKMGVQLGSEIVLLIILSWHVPLVIFLAYPADNFAMAFLPIIIIIRRNRAKTISLQTLLKYIGDHIEFSN